MTEEQLYYDLKCTHYDLKGKGQNDGVINRNYETKCQNYELKCQSYEFNVKNMRLDGRIIS